MVSDVLDFQSDKQTTSKRQASDKQTTTSKEYKKGRIYMYIISLRS